MILVLPDCWILGGRSCAMVQVPKHTYTSSSHALFGGMACTLSCPSSDTVVLTHVSSHVLLQQKPVAPRELWLSGWKVDEQQEAEIVQGSQQGE